MMATRTHAKNALLKHIVTAWKSNPISSTWPITFDSVASQEKDGKPGFCKITVRHLFRDRTSLGLQARYECLGRVTVSVYTHIAVRNKSQASSQKGLVSQGDGLTASDSISETLLNALSSRVENNCVTFEQGVAKERELEGSYFITDVTALFRYDQEHVS